MYMYRSVTKVISAGEDKSRYVSYPYNDSVVCNFPVLVNTYKCIN